MAAAAAPPPLEQQQQQPQQHACYLIVHNVSKKHNGGRRYVHACLRTSCRRRSTCADGGSDGVAPCACALLPRSRHAGALRYCVWRR
jgi:hypothetical protein